ncbi:MAG TPA: NifB/NifX family molybdenum-iron cluster-binding protein [Bacteroidota bacterium]|nr:NifB/NifX family molybdenum-iron cluster-binding protein [Bacteroidota bacterium]
MIIAIPAHAEGWNAEVDERFGRARGFALVDSESGAWRFVDNGTADAEHGAGTGAVRSLLQLGVAVLLAGRVGPKAAEALEAAGITCLTLEGQGSVAEAWNWYKQQRTTP